MSEGIIFQQETELVPTIKGLVLIESLDKLADITLANNTNIIENRFLNNINHKTVPGAKNIIEDIKKNNPGNHKKDKQLIIHSDQLKIAKKYFQLWKTKIKQNGNYGIKKEKIDTFLEELKRHKSVIINKNNNLKENNKQLSNHSSKCVKHKGVSEIYKRRYRAQEDLIKNQQIKLQEQDKIIQNLKLGIIVEDAEKSLENSKYDIREIFRKCSEKVKCKITPPDAVEKNEHIIELRSNKAPKCIAQMEKRAVEREIRRNIILEKKKIIEEKKRKEIEKAIEQKKVIDEEQKQKNLDAIKERRRLEVELEKKRKENRQKYLESINKANKFYSRKMKCKIFKGFKKLMNMKNEYMLKSELFYNRLLEKKYMNQWLIFVKTKIEKENFDSDCLYSYKLLKRVLRSWHSVLILRKQSMQVAEDLYDMKLQSRIFIQWHRQICQQQMTEYKNLQVSEKHYNSRILLQYFYQWKSLSAVLQLEKAKEEKKRKWREKVWEIVPDYEPCTEIM